MDPRVELTRLAAACDEEGALRALRAGGGTGRRERGTGYTALHYACQYGLEELVKALLEMGAQVDCQSKDLLLQGAVVESGGQTPLHLACKANELKVVEYLLAARADVSLPDWDGFQAGEMAKLRPKAEELCRLLPSDTSEEILLERGQRAKELRKLRAKKQMEVPEHLRHAYTLERVWSLEECSWVLEQLKAHVQQREDGWTVERHAAYATTDVPCEEVVELDDWVRNSLRERVFERLAQRHGWSCETLYFRDLFFVKYSAEGQAGLSLHRDGSVVSFNILLNSAKDFEGGGTYVEADDKAYEIAQGDCLVHSGKLRHGGQPITKGERFILVAFLDVD